MKAKQLPSGKWNARAYNKYTGERPSFTADTKKEAERLARVYMFGASEHPSCTFQEAYEYYIESKRAILSERTIGSYESYAQYYAPLMKLKVDKITSRILQQWVAELSHNRSAKTVDNIYSNAMSILRLQGLSTRFNVTRPKVVKPKLNLPSNAIVVSLVELSKGTELYVPILLAAYGCMRRAEIAALTMDDIDFNNKKIHITKSTVISTKRKWIIKSTKNHENRTITPPDLIFDAIKENGLPNLTPDDITSDFRDFQKDNGIEPVRFHDLRHYCAAKMLSLNLPISFVQEYGGWKEKRVLLEIYDYVIDEVRTHSTEIWSKNFQ